MTRAICIGIETPQSDWDIDASLHELKELSETAGLTVVCMEHQKRSMPHPKSYIGTGKIRMIQTIIDEHHIDVAIFDDELSPNQQRTLENNLQVKVLDRTSLVLDIFSQRAKTKEAQIQIELAQLNYLQPRLRRMWTHLSRLGGGVGTRGPGETQLEVDRRQIGTRISKLNRDLIQVEQTRDTQRKNRHILPYVTVALMGYTNAGKSTIHHLLTDSHVLQEDKLFATLDPTSRQLVLDSGQTIIISDTVGFIRKLPHQLVQAFKSTLEEVIYADIILHIIDCSNPKWMDLMETSRNIMRQLNAPIQDEIIIFNKIDRAKDPVLTKIDCIKISPHFICAKHPSSRQALLSIINGKIATYQVVQTFRIPYNKMAIHSLIHQNSEIISTDHRDTYIEITCRIHPVIAAKLMHQLHECPTH